MTFEDYSKHYDQTGFSFSPDVECWQKTFQRDDCKDYRSGVMDLSVLQVNLSLPQSAEVDIVVSLETSKKYLPTLEKKRQDATAALHDATTNGDEVKMQQAQDWITAIQVDDLISAPPFVPPSCFLTFFLAISLSVLNLYSFLLSGGAKL